MKLTKNWLINMNLINELKKKIIQNKKFIFNNKNHDLVDELKKKVS